jgi:hypothetical protein
MERSPLSPSVRTSPAKAPEDACARRIAVRLLADGRIGPSWDTRRRARPTLVRPELPQALVELALLGRKALGDADVETDVEVTASRPVAARKAVAAQPDDRPGLSPGRDA